MVSDRPNVLARAKYTVKETANILGISRKTLWRYTCDLKIRPVVNQCNNRRMYYGSEIMALWGAEY